MTTLPSHPPEWRDPQRYFTPAQRAEIAARQHHLCGHCGADLIDGQWDAHHVIRHEHGGPTRVDNGAGLCRPCHQTAEILLVDFTPRQWQYEAEPKILERLSQGHFATLNVAPGGGKTPFAGWLARTLLERGVIQRVGIAVPYVHLCEQWQETLSGLFGIYVGVNEISERRGQSGVVLTYPLATRHIDQLVTDARAARTLWILDEVHHLSVDERQTGSAWALAIEHLVGQIDHPKMPVLNLTGTLFRSKRNERISTIRYDNPSPGVLESTADYTVTAAELIQQGVLRILRVLGFDQDMVVKGIDPAEDAIHDDTVRAIDLDAYSKRNRNRIFGALIRNPDYIDGMLKETFRRLEEASFELHVSAASKGLVIADDQKHAQQIYGHLVALGYGDVSYLAISEEKDAEENIRRFRKEARSAILVAVQKVTEGFDVPDITVLTYLNAWCAPLFINQMVGRVMRVTAKEKELDQRCHATVLIPDDLQIRRAFADVLVGAMRILELPPDPCERCGRQHCACPLWSREKQCTRCGMPWFLCLCTCRWCGNGKRACGCPPEICRRCGQLPPECGCEPVEDVTVEILDQPELSSSNINGHQIRELKLIAQFKEKLLAIGASGHQADVCAAAYEQLRDAMPWSTRESEEETDEDHR